MFRVGLAVKEILENCLTAVKATFDEIYQNASIKRPGACIIFEPQRWVISFKEATYSLCFRIERALVCWGA